MSGSANIGFNRAYGYSNTPLIFEALANPNFGDNTKTAFSYSLGLGVQTAINAQWHAGIGYEFLDFGKSRLNRASGQTMNSGLQLSHLYTHGVLLNVSYVA